MPSVNEFRAYVRSLNDNLALGNATEHTHRPALKTLMESIQDGVTATNEPKRIECGAPDYAVTKDGPTPLAVGYVEAKETEGDLEAIESDYANPTTANGAQLRPLVSKFWPPFMEHRPGVLYRHSVRCLSGNQIRTIVKASRSTDSQLGWEIFRHCLGWAFVCFTSTLLRFTSARQESRKDSTTLKCHYDVVLPLVDLK